MVFPMVFPLVFSQSSTYLHLLAYPCSALTEFPPLGPRGPGPQKPHRASTQKLIATWCIYTYITLHMHLHLQSVKFDLTLTFTLHMFVSTTNYSNEPICVFRSCPISQHSPGIPTSSQMASWYTAFLEETARYLQY